MSQLTAPVLGPPAPLAARRRCRALGVLALLLAVVATAGCGNPGQLSSACRSLRGRPPAGLSVQWVAPQGVVRRTASYRHNVISVGVHRPDGLSLSIGNPYYLWCELVPEPQVDSWIAHAETLLPELHDLRLLPESHGEVLIVDFPVPDPDGRPGLWVSRSRYVEVKELTPAGIEAARSLSCLAGAAFGDRAEKAILELTPRLATRAGFPGTCHASNQGRFRHERRPTHATPSTWGPARGDPDLASRAPRRER